MRVTQEDMRDKRRAVRSQLSEIIATSAGKGPVVTCCCGRRFPLRFAFRCFYCCEWFCEKCAPKHFGMTREDWYRAQESDR